MATHRTALGKQLDMAALAAKHERVRAVGNMNVNARGDVIDAYGRVVVPVTEKVSQSYARTIGNKSAHVTKQVEESGIPEGTKSVSAPLPSVEEEYTILNSEEQEIENNTDNDIEIENIRARELKGTNDLYYKTK